MEFCDEEGWFDGGSLEECVKGSLKSAVRGEEISERQETRGWGEVVLEGWNSRSSWRSVWPRSP